MTSSYGYETVLPPLSPSSYLNFDSFSGSGGGSGSGSASASSSSRASSINGGGDDQQQQQQQLGGTLLSPGIVDDGSSSLDLFKYYLDMQQSQQQKEQQSTSTSAGAMQTISMADIEQFNALFAGSGGIPAPDASAAFGSAAAASKGMSTESANYFSFGGDGMDTNGMSTSPSLPPSAFETATSASSENFDVPDGSDMPVVPTFLLDGQIVPKIEEEDEEENEMHHYQQQAAHRLPPMPVAPAAPVTATQPKKRAVSTGNNKRRAVSQTVMDDISEGDEDGSQQQPSDEDDEDALRYDGPAPSTKKGASKRAAAASSSSSKKGSSRSTKATTPAASAAHGGQSHPHALVPVPEYEDRPSKEEYEKLSSKEKRQLRNKISARNFRHRRKAHIDTLEAEINERDGIIDVLKEEVGTLRSENTGLRADIEILKKNWESIASKISASAAPVASTSTLSPRLGSSASGRGLALSPEEDDLYGSASLPALSPPSSSASTNGDAETEVSYDQRHASVSSGPSTSSAPAPATVQRRSTRTAGVPAPKPNYRKDLSAANGSSFWDTTSPFSSGFRGAGMDVHTTFVPEISLGSPAAALSEKKESGSQHFGAPGFAQMQEQRAQQQQQQQPSCSVPRMNMNPALNGLTSEQINALREQFVSSAPNANAGSRARSMAGKDQLVDNNGDRSFFDANPYLLLRNDNFQDYRGQLYSKLANNVAGIQATRNGTQSSLDGLRPAYFSASPSPSAALSSPSADAGPAPALVEKIAAIAQKTLLEKMTSAFWDAFAGEQPSPKPMVRTSASAKREMDPAKVAAVLSGKSSLQVVPNQTMGTEQDGLQEMMDKLDLQK